MKFTGKCTDEAASLISAGAFNQLQCLELDPNFAEPGTEIKDRFLFNVFKNTKLPALRSLKIAANHFCNRQDQPVAFPTSKPLLAKLVDVDLVLNDTATPAGLYNFINGLWFRWKPCGEIVYKARQISFRRNFKNVPGRRRLWFEIFEIEVFEIR